MSKDNIEEELEVEIEEKKIKKAEIDKWKKCMEEKFLYAFKEVADLNEKVEKQNREIAVELKEKVERLEKENGENKVIYKETIIRKDYELKKIRTEMEKLKVSENNKEDEDQAWAMQVEEVEREKEKIRRNRDRKMSRKKET